MMICGGRVIKNRLLYVYAIEIIDSQIENERKGTGRRNEGL